MECGSWAAAITDREGPGSKQREPGSRTPKKSRHHFSQQCCAASRKKGHLQLELGELEEVAGAGVDFAALEFAEALGAEFLDGEAAED